jgi:hypothetical protein
MIPHPLPLPFPTSWVHRSDFNCSCTQLATPILTANYLRYQFPTDIGLRRIPRTMLVTQSLKIATDLARVA